MALVSATSFSAEIVLQDNFDYASNAALQSAWTTLDGNPPGMVQESSAVAGAPFAEVVNAAIQRSLSQTIADNLTLSVDFLCSTGQRTQSVGVFDITGKNGYVIYLNSGAGTNPKEGLLRVMKVAIPEADPISWQDYYSTHATSLSGAIYIGTFDFYPTSETSNTPMVNAGLTWSKDGSLALSVNGVLQYSGTDTSLSSFSSVVIEGNGSGYFNNLTVTIPEPASMALLGIGLSLLACRRRRKACHG